MPEGVCKELGIGGGEVALVPLGGLGEIGLNCMAVVSEGGILLIDCGVTFPRKPSFGVDIVLPDFAFLEKNHKEVVGVFVTHGHEDHFGALPYLLKHVDCPVYAAPFAAALIERRLAERGPQRAVKINQITPGVPVRVGPYSVEPIHVNHSVPQACGLAINTPAGTLVHTGDFKIEVDPADEKPADLVRFTALGEEGVRCLLSDSTNVFERGHSLGEFSVLERLREIFAETSGKIVVTLFSSNIHRIRTLFVLAEESGRKVRLIGRSLVRNVEIARELSLLPPGAGELIVTAKEAALLSSERLLYLTTGSQGEIRSAMHRIIRGEEKEVSPGPGDAVIFSSRVIPGNETVITDAVNRLMKSGAKVYQGELGLHASGHGHRAEQRLIIELTNPSLFVPVHGEYRHLCAHAEMAEGLGVKAALVIQNGETLILSDKEQRRGESVCYGRRLVHGKCVDDYPSIVVGERGKLSRTGIVLVSLLLSEETGRLLSEPTVKAIGVLPAEQKEEVIRASQRALVSLVEEANREGEIELEKLEKEASIAVRREFKSRLGFKPVMNTTITELSSEAVQAT